MLKQTVILTAFVAVLLLPGCTTDTVTFPDSPDATVQEGGEEGSSTTEQGVSFTVTRAAQNASPLDISAFSVFGWMRDSTARTYHGQPDMVFVDSLWLGSRPEPGRYDPEYVFAHGNGVWRTIRDYVWPRTFYACDFFALYPIEANETANEILVEEHPGGQHRPHHYIVHDNRNFSGTLDLLVASLTTNHLIANRHARHFADTTAAFTDAMADTVGLAPLRFHHALSAVNFVARLGLPELRVRIYSLQIVNIRPRATFHYSELPLQPDVVYHPDVPMGEVEPVGWWVPDESVTDTLTFYENTTGLELTEMDTDYPLDDQGLHPYPQFVVPQQLTTWLTPPLKADVNMQSNAFLKIGCFIGIDEYYDDVEKTHLHDFSDHGYIYVPMPVDPVPRWDIDRSYTYTITFGGGFSHDGDPIIKPVTITTTITDWDTAPGQNRDGNAVIKTAP